MKKFIITATAIVFIGIGGSPAFAQTPAPIPPVLPGVTLPLPIECSEQDVNAPDTDGDGIPNACVNFYITQAGLPPVSVQVPPVGAQVPPVVTTTTTTIVLATGPLPRTGSGVSPLLGMGAALLVGGGIIVVATRRRSMATAN